MFYLEGELIRIVAGSSASVSQPLNPTLLVATEDFVARLARGPKTPCRDPPRTAALHPSPNTPFQGITPSQKKQEEVLGVRYDVLPMSQAAQNILQNDRV